MSKAERLLKQITASKLLSFVAGVYVAFSVDCIVDGAPVAAAAAYIVAGIVIVIAERLTWRQFVALHVPQPKLLNSTSFEYLLEHRLVLEGLIEVESKARRSAEHVAKDAAETAALYMAERNALRAHLAALKEEHERCSSAVSTTVTVPVEAAKNKASHNTVSGW